MSEYYRPICQSDSFRPKTALTLAKSRIWFTHCERLSRKKDPQIISVEEVPDLILEKLTSERKNITGLSLENPVIMGVLNVTPDSFSDGGQYNDRLGAIARGMQMINEGANIIDIGGESTRPGADFIDISVEIRRVIPVIAGLKLAKVPALISIDTRKSKVAAAALDAGAVLVNDVTALSFDEKSLDFIGKERPYVCLMHASGDPKTMQNNPIYDNVLLDVYDYLERRIEACLSVGLPREKIIIDPGIGFGKTLEHNLMLIKGLSLFHSLGCAILLGVSRKRFIGDITHINDPSERSLGSVAVALEALSQGVQIIRCHDVADHKQAFDLWQAMNERKSI